MIGYIGEAVRKLAFAGSKQDRFPAAAAAAAAEMSHTWHLGPVVASCLAMPEAYYYLNHFRTFQMTDDDGPFIERLLRHLVGKLTHNDILKPVSKSVLRALMNKRTTPAIDVMVEINLIEDLLKCPEANECYKACAREIAARSKFLGNPAHNSPERSLNGALGNYDGRLHNWWLKTPLAPK
jgi:hypothetical protein